MKPFLVERGKLNPEYWDAFVDRHMGGWFWHTSRWLDYSLAYAPGAVDKSFAVCHESTGRVIGVVPLVIGPDGKACAGGQHPPAAIFDVAEQESLVLAWRHAEGLAGVEVHRCSLRPGATAPPGHPVGCLRFTDSTFVVELGKDEHALWRDLRKSYKNLVHRGQSAYDIEASQGPWAVALAETLHLDAAGRRTRAHATWEMMAKWATDGYALTILAKPKGTDEPPVGFAYIIRYKNWAYYASGATTVDDVGHALQWEAIRTLRADGRTRWYEMGHDAAPDADVKAKGIAAFKAGFGGAPVSVVRLEPEDKRSNMNMRRV